MWSKRLKVRGPLHRGFDRDTQTHWNVRGFEKQQVKFRSPSWAIHIVQRCFHYNKHILWSWMLNPRDCCFKAEVQPEMSKEFWRSDWFLQIHSRPLKSTCVSSSLWKVWGSLRNSAYCQRTDLLEWSCSWLSESSQSLQIQPVPKPRVWARFSTHTLQTGIRLLEQENSHLCLLST